MTKLHHQQSTRSIGAALLTLFLYQSAFATDLYIISHSNLSLDGKAIREIYLGEKNFSDVIKLKPVDNASAQSAMLSRVVKLDANKYSTRWVKRSFRDGINLPPLKTSDAEVIEFVKRTPGAIGYVSTVTADVVVIGKY